MRHKPITGNVFRVWVCAFFACLLSLTPLGQHGGHLDAATTKKVQVEVKSDTTLEKDSVQIPLKNPPLFLDERFYISVKSIDEIFGTQTIWNKKRNVLEMNAKKQNATNAAASPTPKGTGTATGANSNKGTATNANSSANNQTTNTNKAPAKGATPTPRGFKTPAPQNKNIAVTATPVGFLFMTPTPKPTNKVTPTTTNRTFSNQNSQIQNNSNGSGINNSNQSSNGLNSTVTDKPVQTATPPPYLLRGSPTPKPTPKNTLIPLPTSSTLPFEFNRIMNYSAEYLDGAYQIGCAFYRDVCYFRYRDLVLMGLDLSNTDLYKDLRTGELFISIEQFRSRLQQMPSMSLLQTPIIRGETDNEKLDAITTFFMNNITDSNYRAMWITSTGVENEFKLISQHEMDATLTEQLFNLQKNANGYRIQLLNARSI